MEAEILERINRETGVGPQGFGGDTTALSVAIETAPTHIAGLPGSRRNQALHGKGRFGPLRH